jgi:hypothetical protein
MTRDLTKLTVNLVPEAVTALDWAAQLAGDTRTDTVNRALQLYAILMQETCDGSGTVQIRRADGTVADVTIT